MKIEASNLLKGLDKLETKTHRALNAYVATGALKLESEAKQNARWQDRTGAARQRLKGTYTETANGYRLWLRHGVNYGVFLEMAHEKRYSIIPETLEYVGLYDIMPGLQTLMRRLGGDV